jgi:hypothetical protein
MVAGEGSSKDEEGVVIYNLFIYCNKAVINLINLINVLI